MQDCIVCGVAIFDWDAITDGEMYYYCWGSDNIVRFHDGWDYTWVENGFERVWMEEEK